MRNLTILSIGHSMDRKTRFTQSNINAQNLEMEFDNIIRTMTNETTKKDSEIKELKQLITDLTKRIVVLESK
jgi:hypothetical protein